MSQMALQIFLLGFSFLFLGALSSGIFSPSSITALGLGNDSGVLDVCGDMKETQNEWVVVPACRELTED